MTYSNDINDDDGEVDDNDDEGDDNNDDDHDDAFNGNKDDNKAVFRLHCPRAWQPQSVKSLFIL